MTNDEIGGILLLALIGWLIYRFVATQKFNRDYDDYLQSRGMTHDEHVEEVMRQDQGIASPQRSRAVPSIETTGPVLPIDPRVNSTIATFELVIQLGGFAVTDPDGPYFALPLDQVHAELASWFLVWLNQDLRRRFEDNPHGEEVVASIRRAIEGKIPLSASIIDDRKSEFYSRFIMSGGNISLEEQATLPLSHLSNLRPSPEVAADLVQCLSALVNEISTIWKTDNAVH